MSIETCRGFKIIGFIFFCLPFAASFLLLILGAPAFEKDYLTIYVPFLILGLPCMIVFSRLERIKTKEAEKAYIEWKKAADEFREKVERSTVPAVIDCKNFVLRNGEVCHYQQPASSVVTKNLVTRYEGRSSGVSVRVMKGVSIRSGSSRGVPIREDVKRKYDGTLTITNQRVVMSSEKGGFEKAIGKISYIEEAEEELVIQADGSLYTIKTDYPFWPKKIIELVAKG